MGLDVTIKIVADQIIITMIDDGVDKRGEQVLITKGA